MAKDTKTTKTKKAPAKKTAGNDLLKNALCYIPLVGPVLFFIESKKSADLMKHIKYGTFLFIAYILVSYVLGVVHAPFGGMLALVYLIAIAFLGYKAYNGEAVQLDFIDKIEDEVKDRLK